MTFYGLKDSSFASSLATDNLYVNENFCQYEVGSQKFHHIIEVINQTIVYLHHQTSEKRKIVRVPCFFPFYLCCLFPFLNLPVLNYCPFSFISLFPPAHFQKEGLVRAGELWIYQLHLMAYCPPEENKEII